MEIDLLKRRIALDSSRLVRQQSNYNELVKAQQALFNDDANADIIQTKNLVTPFDAAADTNSLRLALQPGAFKGATTPENLKVYLIPRTAANAAIIKQASTYEIRCDEMNLDRAKDKRLARYVNGNYIFLNVPPGTYFVKICTYYGGFYNVTKKEQGNMALRFDASPPVQ